MYGVYLAVAVNSTNDAQDGYEKEDSLVGLADTVVLDGILCLRKPYVPAGQISFKKALEIYVQIRHSLGQAVGLYHLGIYFLRATNFERAEGSFQEALCSHTQTGNLTGQADDLTKISEVYLPQGSIQEALTKIPDALKMPVHIQIGGVSGQGDDVYIQAGSLSRFDGAGEKMKRALDLHIQAGGVYGQARDKAILGSVLWAQFRKGRAKDEKLCDEKHVKTPEPRPWAIGGAKQLSNALVRTGKRRSVMMKYYIGKCKKYQCEIEARDKGHVTTR